MQSAVTDDVESIMETKITESTSPNYIGPTDPDNDFMCATQLQRIADSLTEIIKMIYL